MKLQCMYKPLKVELLQELALWSHMSTTLSRSSAAAAVDKFCSATELQHVLESRHAPLPYTDSGVCVREGEREGGREYEEKEGGVRE